MSKFTEFCRHWRFIKAVWPSFSVEYSLYCQNMMWLTSTVTHFLTDISLGTYPDFSKGWCAWGLITGLFLYGQTNFEPSIIVFDRHKPAHENSVLASDHFEVAALLCEQTYPCRSWRVNWGSSWHNRLTRGRELFDSLVTASTKLVSTQYFENESLW